MDPKKLAELKALLGLPDAATDDDILASCGGMKAATPPPPSAPNPPDAQAMAAAVKQVVEPLRASLKSVETENQKLRDDLFARDFDAIVASAKLGENGRGRVLTDGLIASAKKLAKVEGLDSAKSLLESIPATVTLAASGIGSKQAATLTKQEAHQKVEARAAELRASKQMTHTESIKAAMLELPTEALASVR